MSDKLNLFQRILAIQTEVEMVSKGGYNDFHKYKYVTEADILKALKPLLTKHGVCVMFSVIDSGVVCENIMRVTGKYTWVNIDNPSDRFETLTVGDGDDVSKAGKVGDKGIFKAMTGAQKYGLLKCLFIATGDDPEQVNRYEKAMQPAQPPPNAAKSKEIFDEFKVKLGECKTAGKLNKVSKNMADNQADMTEGHFCDLIEIGKKKRTEIEKEADNGQGYQQSNSSRQSWT